MIRTISLCLCLLAAAGCASGTSSSAADTADTLSIDDLMSGGRFKGPKLDAALSEAARHKLGTAQNPVRADMPPGQRAYLNRLVCSSGKPPAYGRIGNVGAGVFGSIVDAYDVRCDGGSPAQTTIYMDMYFPGYSEAKAVEGFQLLPK
jgi:hypothetical protein